MSQMRIQPVTWQGSKIANRLTYTSVHIECMFGYLLFLWDFSVIHIRMWCFWGVAWCQLVKIHWLFGMSCHPHRLCSRFWFGEESRAQMMQPTRRPETSVNCNELTLCKSPDVSDYIIWYQNGIFFFFFRCYNFSLQLFWPSQHTISTYYDPVCS